MKNHFIIMLIAAATLRTAVSAQNLSTEVVVDRNIVPTERAATRPGWLIPTIVLPEFESSELSPVTYTALSPLNRNYYVLDPASGAFAAEKTPYRGYIAGGYFPTLDFGVSAGYRIIDKERMSLGARLQFDSERYRPYGEAADNGAQYFVTGTAGIDFAWRPIRDSQLSAFAQYNYLREKTTYWYPQNVNTGEFGVSWHSKAGVVNYSADVDFGFENSSTTYWYLTTMDSNPTLPGRSQQHTRFNVAAEVPVRTGNVGASVNGNFVHTSVDGKSTLGFVDITPYYSCSNRQFAARIGVKLDFARTFLSNGVNVMPDIKLHYKPVSSVGIWVNVTGGSHVNSYASLRQESIYQVFTDQFDLSRIPFAVEGGVNVGPFRGFYAGVFGGYATADDWLMAANSIVPAFMPLNINGWHAGIKAGAEWRFIKAEVSADFAPSDYNTAWYMRRDRAATVVDATVELTPINPLTVTVGYELRSCRKAYYKANGYLNLGNVNDISLGAEWRFNDAFAVFGRVQNLLGRRYMEIAWQPSRRVNGLVGISYKF